MLPGFRLLLAAIMLSVSLLVFGLGATALLRSAHEEFASNPSWRGAPEVKFAQPAETTTPVLATLRVDTAQQEPQQDAAPPPAAETEAAAEVAAAPAPAAAVTAEQPSPGEVAAAEVSSAAPVTPGAPPTADDAPAGEAAAVQVENGSATNLAAAEQPAQQAAQEPKDEIQLASSADGATPSTPGDAPPAAAAEANAAADETAGGANPADPAMTKIATLGGPPVEITTAVEAGADTEADETAAKKRAEAKRAAKRRRIAAARARLAAQQAQQQLQGGPFFTPQPTRPARAP